MRTIRTVSELRNAIAAERADGRTVALVPTMGAFHEGHLSLMRAARAACDTVVVSLFVNPTQFRPGEDLDAYPRDEQRDAALAAEEGVAILFAPTVAEVYPSGARTTIQVDGITEVLCGDRERRGPDHFAGVTTIVAKLFNMVGPDVAVFGQKDAQQVAVIRQMVRDLDIPVRIEVVPTVREHDGLALSSRNAYLDDGDRERAAALSRALAAAEALVADGETDADPIVAAAAAELDRADIEPEYVELRSPADLSPVERIEDDALLAIAAQVGAARLIDNTLLRTRSANNAKVLGGTPA